ncbi:MAG: response regulator [Verrucomicrobiota bacterium]
MKITREKPPRKIVVIEDNLMNMELTVDILEVAGYKVFTATNAEDGIRLVKTEMPGLVLMDISLSGMDGLSATSALKKDPATRHIPVMAVTAHAMRGDEERILHAGCCACVTKPIDVQEFRSKVSQFLNCEPSNE